MKTGTALITATHSENGYVLHIGHVTEGFIEISQDAILTVDFVSICTLDLSFLE